MEVEKYESRETNPRVFKIGMEKKTSFQKRRMHLRLSILPSKV